MVQRLLWLLQKGISNPGALQARSCPNQEEGCTRLKCKNIICSEDFHKRLHHLGEVWKLGKGRAPLGEV